MDIAITRMSSKGQIVIPAEMRKGIHAGEKIVIIKNNHQFVMKKANEICKRLKEDLEFAKRTDEALKRYEKGKFREMDFEEFSKKLKKW